MAAVETGGGSQSKGRKKHKKRGKKRIGVRIDMTPMVDVAFLLLTFFMLTTVLRKQQTLEINLPPADAKVEVAQSNLITVYVDDNNKIFWNTGTEKPKSVEFNGLIKFFEDQLAQNSKIIVLVKLDRKSKFQYMVDIIDDLNLAKLTRFSLAPMNDNDKKFLSKAT
jgi:biopolymer transport protein ExbD